MLAKRTQVLILAPESRVGDATTAVAREWGALVGVSVASLIGKQWATPIR